MERLRFVASQIREIEEARQKRLEQEPATVPHAMVRLLARVVGIGVETADMLVHEVLSRPLRDRRAVARYAGLTGSPDESGAKRRVAHNPQTNRSDSREVIYRFRQLSVEDQQAAIEFL